MRFRNIYLYGIALLLFIAVSILQSMSFRQMNRFTKEVDSSRETISTLQKLGSHFKSAQIYSPSYQKQIAEHYYLLMKKEAIEIPAEINQLNILIRDKESKKLFETVQRLVNKHLHYLMENNIVEMINAGEGWRLGDIFLVEKLINRIVEREQAQLDSKRIELSRSARNTDHVSTILMSVALLIILVTYFTNYRLFSRRMWLEDFLQSILKSSQYGVISFKAIRNREGKVFDFKIEFANPVIQELIGYSPDQIVGIKVTQSVIFSKRFLQWFIAVMETGEKMNQDVQLGKKWLYLLLAKNGERVTASFQDITPLKNYQQELETTVHKLEATNAELEQYAYAASHDLQEPLRKINIFSNLLLERKREHFDDRDKEYLSKIVSATGRMTNLVTDLLSFSSLKKSTEFVPVDLNQSLSAVLEDLDLLIQQKSATIHAETLPTIQAIPLQMQQIFYNLISNALKFSKAEVKPEVWIKSHMMTKEEIAADSRLDPSRSYTRICFRDNGIGFDNEYAEQIFGLFKRLHSKDVYTGSGIGLALCLRVAENHGGYIYAKGEPGVGAEFCVVLGGGRQGGNEWKAQRH